MLHGEHLFKCCERHYQLYRFDARVLQLRAVEYNTNSLTTAVTTTTTTVTTTATTPHILRIAPAYPIIERPPPFDEDESQDRLIIDTDALSDSFRQQDEEEERQSNVLIEFPPTPCPVQSPVMKMEQEENLSPPTPCPVQPPVMKMERQEEELSPPTPCPVPTPVMKMEREQDDEMEIDIAQIEIRCNREESETLPQIPVPREEEEEPSTSGDVFNRYSMRIKSSNPLIPTYFKEVTENLSDLTKEEEKKPKGHPEWILDEEDEKEENWIEFCYNRK
ncbi:uncharacterized protein LOC129230141 [Uloborus diversus]|uniref:uncharacterized protein LOC129230141 n=1 Tax=Uloborus diversus TaxID=327109 RepID=UPI00240A5948|nr:uncharacterized protein LOC129230141 [Uloborus diversus]